MQLLKLRRFPLLRAKKLRRMHDAPGRSAWKYAL